MRLPEPLLDGHLIRRYKRFLADIALADGRQVTAHCPNSGSLLSCNIPGSPVRISVSDNPRRKLKYTWELVRVNDVWVGINTHYPNRLVKEGIEQGIIQELQGYEQILQEVRYGENSRIDLLLQSGNDRCYVEIKNVTLVENSVAYFPDAVTVRGQKHLRELMAMVEAGHRAVIFFLVQREDNHQMAPADHIDPEYGRLLRQAHDVGVEILAYQAHVTPEEITVNFRLPVRL
ncbi:MAG: DNA/RNA nuclease SfsA [Calditrichaeota bacterium]|nr:DNA/RNA nuclease SfsA [Calditrichota bacterium]